jgi:4-alpha-glucanotransferase
VWSRPELFELGENGAPLGVAGVPPDYFSETGQLWGNPLYRWDHMAENGYAWWIDRLAANLRLTDRVRLDHFRGFAAYWRVPAGEETAVNGTWAPGPGRPLFNALEAAFGSPLPLVAEDLGEITPDVHELRRGLGLPGMRVLQFAFDDLDGDHIPHRLTPRTVVYTGTHDNDTTAGWFRSASPETRQRFTRYTGHDGPEGAARALTRLAYTTVADLAVIPAQDVLGLGGEARMNIPGQGEGNWAWRLDAGQLTEGHATELRQLAEVSGRLKAH